MHELFLSAALAALTVSAGTADVIDRLMAVVGSHVITLSDVRAIQTFGLLPGGVKSDSIPEVLAYLIDRQLELGEVERYSAPEPDAAQVDRRMSEIRARLATPSAFEQALARTAMSEQRLRQVVADDLRIDAYLEQQFGAAAQPTPEEVQRYYAGHPDEFTRAGRLLPFDEAQPAALERVTAARRTALIRDWLDRLRRRSNVLNLYTPR